MTMCVILFVLFVLSSNSFAQEEASQSPMSSVQPPASDVVELESDLSVADMKMGNTSKENKLNVNKSPTVKNNAKASKLGIKPSSAYKKMDKKAAAKDEIPSLDDLTSDAQKKAAAEQKKLKVDEQMKATEKESEGGIESDVVKQSLPVDEFIPSKPDAVLTDKQVVMISESLRKLIDENDQLKKQLSEVDQQLKNLRGEQKLGGNRLQEITIERDALRQQTVSIANHNSENEKLVKDLQEQLTNKQKEYETRIFNLQNDLAKFVQNPDAVIAASDTVVVNEQSASSNNQSRATNHETRDAAVSNRSISVNVASSASVEDAKKEGKRILDGVNALKAQRSQLLKDEAKVHYNMGNTYYNQGDYLSAAEEYEKAIAITPEDSNAHYNLAFVSGEILHHPKAAIIHYKKYLFLNPHAEDAEKVRQKIIESEILVKGKIRFDSQMDQELRNKQNEVNEISSY